MSTPAPGLVHSADEATEEEAVYRSLLLPSYGLSLGVSVAALISLVFTLWIFLRRRDATAGARGMVLLIVTGLFTAMSLTVLHIVNIDQLVVPAGNGTGSDGSGRALERFMEVQYVISNTSLLLRNWWVTFLTGIRFVVIIFPLRVPEMLTRKRQLAAFFAILTGSAAFSIVRHLEEKTCTAHAAAAAAAAEAVAGTTGAPGNASSQQPAITFSASTPSSCESFIIFFFVMQTGVPVPTVLVLSVALAVHLCAAREPSDTTSAATHTSTATSSSAPATATTSVTAASSATATASSAALCVRSNSIGSSCNALTVPALASGKLQHQSQHQHKSHKPVPSRGLCRKRKATRILLALAATFTVLELPTFVYFILMHFFPHYRCSSPGKARLIFSGLNALVTLDTLANFFIFFVFSESFKREVKRCACRGRLGRKRPVEGGRTIAIGGHSSSELRPLRSVAPPSPKHN